MHSMYYLAFFAAIFGISAALNPIFDPTALTSPYEYKRHIIKNANEKLRQYNLPRISTEEELHAIDANAVIDAIISVVDKVIVDSGLDPFNVFTGTILGVDVDVWIGGYSSIAREGDASIQYYSGTTAVTCMANMTNLAGNISFTIRFLGFVIEAGANAQVASVDFKLALRFVAIDNNGTKSITPYVDDFQISDIGKIDIQVFGLGPLNPFINIISEFIANLVKFVIPLLLNGIVKDILQQVLDYIFHVPQMY